MNDLNYEQDVSIDESGLDTEWLQQPKLMLQYGQYASECKKEVDKAKEKLDLVKAELDKDIRFDPGKYGLNKLTETVIANNILQQDEYQEVSKEYINAKYELEIALTAVRAIDQKKTSLENLVKLYGQQYFAGPKVPRDLSHEWEQKQRQTKVDTNIAKKMKRSK